MSTDVQRERCYFDPSLLLQHLFAVFSKDILIFVMLFDLHASWYLGAEAPAINRPAQAYPAKMKQAGLEPTNFIHLHTSVCQQLPSSAACVVQMES